MMVNQPRNPHWCSPMFCWQVVIVGSTNHVSFYLCVVDFDQSFKFLNHKFILIFHAVVIGGFRCGPAHNCFETPPTSTPHPPRDPAHLPAVRSFWDWSNFNGVLFYQQMHSAVASSTSSGGTRGLSQGLKIRCRGLTNQHSEKSWEMIVNPEMDCCTKTLDYRKKTQKNAKKQESTENQKNTKYRNITQVGARFLHLTCQGDGSAALPSRQLRHWAQGSQRAVCCLYFRHPPQHSNLRETCASHVAADCLLRLLRNNVSRWTAPGIWNTELRPIERVSIGVRIHV